ncbi:MAG: STAS domain-containing protein [Gammaproteobacteria bacterium]|nr:STAS domain-containing protein [Gammaproteobacteria bacterium]
MISFEEQGQLCCAQIEGDLTIYTAAELKSDFERLISDQRDMELSLANVSEIDSSGIQWLMLAQRERNRQNLSFRIIDHSSEVLQIFKDLDLSSYFKEPVILDQEKGE